MWAQCELINFVIMNTYASTHNLKYKVPLIFKLSLQLVSIRFRASKSVSLSIEFVNGKTVVNSKNFHKLEAIAYETILRETIDMPVVAFYDSRKGRFLPQSVDINILSNHGGFNKKLGTGAINISQILNAQALVSREQIKLEKCIDKGALLNIKAIFEFKGSHTVSDVDSLEQSQFSLSTIR